VYQTSHAGSTLNDAFISKLNPDLTTLLASTYLGGSNDDQPRSLSLDSSGNVYISGYTKSANFPTTAGAYQVSRSGTQDAFISKLNPNLTTLLASTYLRGPSGDPLSLALDSSGNVYVAGTAGSTLPTSVGAIQKTFGGGSTDAFISKLNPNLTTLLASTYLGGSGHDSTNSLALDSSGNVYAAGFTLAANFPTTAGAYQVSRSGTQHAFISKLNPNLTTLLASTYLGGSSFDQVNFLILKSSGDIYVTGATGSTNFPTTLDAYQTSSGSVFISQLSNNLSGLPTVAITSPANSAYIPSNGVTITGT